MSSGLSVTELRDGFRRLTGEDSGDVTDTEVNLLLNKSFWEISDKFPFREKETFECFTFTVGSRLYAAPDPFEAVIGISIVDDVNNGHTPLERKTIDWYQQNYDEDTANRSKPSAYIRTDGGYFVWPTPDVAYEGEIYYYITLANLEDDADFPNVPRVWHEIIELGAAHRRLLELRDFVGARELKNEQAIKINTTEPVAAKEAAMDSNRSSLSVPVEIFEV